MKNEDKLSSWAEGIFNAIKEAKKVSDTKIISNKITEYEKAFGKNDLLYEMRDLNCDKSFELFLLEYSKKEATAAPAKRKPKK